MSNFSIVFETCNIKKSFKGLFYVNVFYNILNYSDLCDDVFLIISTKKIHFVVLVLYLCQINFSRFILDVNQGISLQNERVLLHNETKVSNKRIGNN